MPTYYEPPESVMENLLYKQQCDPTRMEYQREQNPLHQPIRGRASRI